MKRIKISLVILIVLGIGSILLIKPNKLSCEYQPYFSNLNESLKKENGGAAVAIIDLDRLDNNIEVVTGLLKNDFKLRLVTKSLPSIELLKYLMQKAKTNRLMVFSEPFISEILEKLNTDSLDIMLGKPLPIDAVSRLSEKEGWNSIVWLIDTKERLDEYLHLAKTKNTQLKISFEINVGLQRGGFQSPEKIVEAIEIILSNKDFLELKGLMGYDGHVPYVPFYINKEKAIRNAFVEVQNSYTSFVEKLKIYYSETEISQMTFNGGGSKTYFYYPEYKEITPINDIAMGSGFLAPAEFSELESIGHQPVLFLCSPILKKNETALLPHAEKISPLINWWNPNLEVSYFMLGGGWPGDVVAPQGLIRNPFWNDEIKSYSNLLPNQSIYSSSIENNLNIGDFVFSQAWEGDGMLCFSKIHLYRQNVIFGVWETYKGGN